MKQRTKVRNMAELALLMAVVLLMAFTPLGYLMTPWGVQITFIVIPVAVGSVVLGPGAGAFLGLVFGITSFARSFQTATGILMLEESVIGVFLCSVPTRVLVGWVPGIFYRAMAKSPKLSGTGQAMCCFLTPLLNTLIYITVNFLVFRDVWLGIAVAAGFAGTDGVALLAFMFGMVAVNGVAEAVACLVLGTAICKALLHIRRTV